MNQMAELGIQVQPRIQPLIFFFVLGLCGGCEIQHILRGNFVAPSSQSWRLGSHLYQIRGDQPIVVAPRRLSDFRYIASVRS